MKIFGQSRSGFYKARKEKPVKTYYKCFDDQRIKTMIELILKKRPTYGYKRVTTMVNRENNACYNRKRIYRIMKMNNLLMLKKPGTASGREHTGKVMVPLTNTRWCSDCLEIRCWNGEKVWMIFALDCCDREIIAYDASVTPITSQTVQSLMAEAVAKRFKSERTTNPVQWLSDRGPIYRANETQSWARKLGLTPCFTAAYSPSSNGMAEAFVGTIKRDYVHSNDCSDAEVVLNSMKTWIEDYNTKAPHSALAMQTPSEYRLKNQTA